MEGKTYAESAAEAFGRVKQLMDEPGWSAFEHKSDPSIVATKRTLPGKSVEIVKASGLVPGIEPRTLRDLVYEQSFEEKKAADSSFLEEQVLEVVDANSKVLYQAYSAPWPVSNRDLVLLRSKWEENGTFYQVDISVSHPKKPNPTGSNVRADLIGCYKYEPADKGCTATYCVYMDPCGNIPSFVVNSNTGKVPARVEAFRKMV